MTVQKLRAWRGVRPAAGPSGVTIMTRLRTTDADEGVLDAVAGHLGRLRRADLAATCRPQPLGTGLAEEAKKQTRKDRLNTRKQQLSALCSARWANAIIRANNDQYRLSREAQYRHLVGLRAAIQTIEKRLAAPTGGTLSAAERKARRKARLPKGYATQAERFQKQRRLQVLRAELDRVSKERADNRVRAVDGGKHLTQGGGGAHADAVAPAVGGCPPPHLRRWLW